MVSNSLTNNEKRSSPFAMLNIYHKKAKVKYILFLQTINPPSRKASAFGRRSPDKSGRKRRTQRKDINSFSEFVNSVPRCLHRSLSPEVAPGFKPVDFINKINLLIINEIFQK